MVKYLWVIFQCSTRGLSHAISVGFYRSCSGKSSLRGPTKTVLWRVWRSTRGWQSEMGIVKCDKETQNPALSSAGRRGRGASSQDHGWVRRALQAAPSPCQVCSGNEQRVNWGSPGAGATSHHSSHQRKPQNSKCKPGSGLFADKQHRALHKNNTEPSIWQTNKYYKGLLQGSHQIISFASQNFSLTSHLC